MSWLSMKLTESVQAFLLFRDAALADGARRLAELRREYAAHQDRFLKYIKHPELLTEVSVDPLADDPDVSLLPYRPPPVAV